MIAATAATGPAARRAVATRPARAPFAAAATTFVAANAHAGASDGTIFIVPSRRRRLPARTTAQHAAVPRLLESLQ